MYTAVGNVNRLDFDSKKRVIGWTMISSSGCYAAFVELELLSLALPATYQSLRLAMKLLSQLLSSS